MLLCFVIGLALAATSTGAVDNCALFSTSPPTASVTRPPGTDHFQVALEPVPDLAISWWSVQDEDGATLGTLAGYGEVLTYNPTDCFKTAFSVVVAVPCSDGTTQTQTVQTVTMEPIPLNKLTTYNPKEYGELRGQTSTEGDEVTMTCQTTQDAERLQDYPAYYTWYKMTSFQEKSPVIVNLSRVPTLTIPAVACKHAGHYYCKVTRCPYHPQDTDACNNNDLGVKLLTPPKLTTRKCRVFGDPHVITFDGARYNYRGECWYVLAMDAARYKWFLYGWFAPCGERSTCLESVSLVARTTQNPGGTQIQILRGYGMNINGAKTFIRRDEILDTDGVSLHFNGYQLLLEIPEFGLKLKWDGLSAAVITLNKDSPTLGICGDNNGDKDNDLSTFYDGKARSSNEFVDAWSLGTGTCKLSKDIPEVVEEPITTLAQLLARGANPNFFPIEFQTDFCVKHFTGARNSEGQISQLKALYEVLPQETIDYFTDTCVHDTRMIDYGFYDKRYSQFASCIVADMFAEEAEAAGVCIDEWQTGSQCPRKELIRNESIRIGCVWTGEDWLIVTS